MENDSPPQTSEEHEAELDLEAAGPPAVSSKDKETQIRVTRMAERKLAIPVLQEMDRQVQETLKLNNDLAGVLAADHGVDFDPELDQARFTVDREGVITLRIVAG